jgi:hypothetical protein
MDRKPLDLDAIEARANAATEPPWYVIEKDDANGWPLATWYLGFSKTGVHEYLGVGSRSGLTVEDAANDADFIAHAREDIPALVARVRELEKEATLKR